jgi:hypothetical protein
MAVLAANIKYAILLWFVWLPDHGKLAMAEGKLIAVIGDEVFCLFYRDVFSWLMPLFRILCADFYWLALVIGIWRVKTIWLLIRVCLFSGTSSF